LKKIHNLHPKLCKLNLVDTIGGSSTKNKKEFGGCQFNEIQFTKFKHTWLYWIQIQPWGEVATKPITRGKEVVALKKSKLHNKST
jgi:hypothetical protein